MTVASHDLRASARLLGGDVSGGGIVCPGPGHSGRDRSLSVKFDAKAPDGFVVHSFAGDDELTCRDHVRERLGLPRWEPGSKRDPFGDLMRAASRPRPSERPAPSLSRVPLPAASSVKRNGKPVRFHPEAELPRQAGELRRHVYKRDGEAVRVKVKTERGWWDWYRAARPDGSAAWQDCRPEAYVPCPFTADTNPLAPDLADEWVFWPEGEKDVETLVRAGVFALTFGGAKDVRTEYGAVLEGRRVIVIADNDEPGRECAARKVEILAGVAAEVRVVDLADAVPDKGDVSDWLASGATMDDLWRRVDEAEPVKEPGADLLPLIDPTTLAGKPIPTREFHVAEMIPARTVSLLGGDGGTGKSLIALQLACATALGRTWLDLPVSSGRALFLTAEDDEDEVHRRLADICQAEGVSFADLGDLRLAPLAGLDAVLALLNGKTGTIAETPLWRALVARVAAFKPRLLVLDTLADLYAGDENNRAQVRQFVGMLRSLALHHGTTVLLLSHPSLSGIASGSGLSGSTAWNNSVRSRLYFRRVLTKDGDKTLEVDPDRRVLGTMKANYGPSGGEIFVRWSEGVFVPEETITPTALDKMTLAARAERIFLDLVIAYDFEGRAVSSSPGPSYAPALFCRDPRGAGIGKGAFVAAMNTLFAAGAIITVESGPPSRRVRRIAPREEGGE